MRRKRAATGTGKKAKSNPKCAEMDIPVIRVAMSVFGVTGVRHPAHMTSVQRV